MIHLDKRCSMFKLNTNYNTTVFTNISIIDPSTMNYFVEDESVKREHYGYYHKEKSHDNIMFIRDITSNFLEMYGFDHNKDIWYMDVIRYNLDNEKKPILGHSSYAKAFPNWRNGHNDIYHEKHPQYPFYSLPFKGESSYK